MPSSARQGKPTIGWREWVSLPGLKVRQVKVKVDTGARSSCLHAFDIEVITRGARSVVRFKVHPKQNAASGAVSCEAELHDFRWIKSSNGTREFRPVILTALQIHGDSWPIELTLTSRDQMGFRMLLGREAIRRRFVVDVNRSFILGKPIRRVKEKPA